MRTIAPSILLLTHFFFNGSTPETVSGAVWLNNYWASNYVESTFDSRSVFFPMFEAQLLTLALGLVSIKYNKRALLLAPALPSLLTAVFMTYVVRKYLPTYRRAT